MVELRVVNETQEGIGQLRACVEFAWGDAHDAEVRALDRKLTVERTGAERSVMAAQAAQSAQTAAMREAAEARAQLDVLTRELAAATEKSAAEGDRREMMGTNYLMSSDTGLD